MKRLNLLVFLTGFLPVIAAVAITLLTTAPTTAAAAPQKAKKHTAFHAPAKPALPTPPQNAVAAAPSLKLPPAPLGTIFGLLPGMTRADVCRLYSPMGGLSSRNRQNFIVSEKPLFSLFGASNLSGSRGQTLQITVRFAPAPASPNLDTSKTGDKVRKTFGDPWKDDVIVSVSEPFYGPMYFD